jgi:DNA-binding NarL/FixJ family response regulator
MLSRESKFNPQFLTHREREILVLFAEGYKDKEIADELYISEMAVKENQVNLMKKLNVENMSSVIDYALGNGLITLYEVLESRFSKTKIKASDPYMH